MSQIYVQEPPTSGKVILVTTHGELELELWCTEIPKACKNFIQLCLEGYYDNSIFNQLIAGFMIQGGDPTGTGKGGESIYGKSFEDEFHQRLKFTHRGIVAMANSQPNDNRSQFFITFDKCTWLDKKHTIFAKVVGDTQYNLMSMQGLDTDSEDRPINPPKIISTKVIVNPFDDIAIRDATKEQKLIHQEKIEEEKQQALQKQSKEKKKKVRNINLLSFGDDETDENQPPIHKKQILSSHDVLNDPQLSKQTVVNIEKIEQEKEHQKGLQIKQIELKSKVKQLEQSNDSTKQSTNIQQISDDKFQKLQQLRNRLILENPDLEKQILSKDASLLEGMKTRRNKKTGQTEIFWEKDEQSDNNSESSYNSTDNEEYADEEQKQIRDKQKQEYDNLKIEYLQFKKDKTGTNNEHMRNVEKEEKRLLSNLELKRLEYVQKKRIKLKEDQVLQKINQFKSKINSKEVNQDQQHWMNNKLKFHIDSARAYSHNKHQDQKSQIDRNLKTDTNEILQDLDKEKIDFGDIMNIDNLIRATEK